MTHCRCFIGDERQESSPCPLLESYALATASLTELAPKLAPHHHRMPLIIVFIRRSPPRILLTRINEPAHQVLTLDWAVTLIRAIILTSIIL